MLTILFKGRSWTMHLPPVAQLHELLKKTFFISTATFFTTRVAVPLLFGWEVSPFSIRAESAVPDTFGLLTLLVSTSSLLGFMLTTVITVRKEMRESDAFALERERQAFELEKLRLEIAQLRSSKSAQRVSEEPDDADKDEPFPLGRG